MPPASPPQIESRTFIHTDKDMKRSLRQLIFLMALPLIAACTSHPSVPSDATSVSRQPRIYPDYTDVVIPSNIAPLNFKVLEGSDECVARITSADGSQQTYGKGKNIVFPTSEWRQLLRQNDGQKISVEIFAKAADGTWRSFRPFTMQVAEPIDEYVSYRVISPSYVAYEMLSINQRNLTNFDEHEIYNNMIISSESDGQCINCHSYQNYGTSNMQFHMRQGHGGTMIVHNGKAYKIDLKTDSTISAGVYPAWHPSLPLIAYSTNATGQAFHTKSLAKIEVEDAASDLILYDIEANTVQHIENDSTKFEVFPWWSPDGKTLYYCSADFDFTKDTLDHQAQVIDRYYEIRYDLYRKPFNPQTKTFGPSQLLYKASARKKSATLPRISPDGRYLLFGQGNYGCFHVWHPDADLYVQDLKTMRVKKLEEANSNRAESYHSWSSNGRWIMFISRRDDGNYSRLYFTYFDRQGRSHKAFEMPQRDPNYYDYYLRSYNVPEFMKEPVKISAQTFASAAKKEPLKATYVSRRRPTARR